MQKKSKPSQTKTIIYGIHSVISLISHNPIRTKVIFLDQNRFKKTNSSNELQILNLAAKNQIPIQYCESKFFEKNYANFLHQGVVAEVSALNLKNKQQLLTLVEQKKELTLILIAKMQDAHNLGAIIRTCQALGVDGIILNQNRTPALNHTVSKVSSGMMETGNFFAANNLAQLIDQLKQLNVWFYGLDMKGKKIHHYLNEHRLADKKVLVIGEEEKGIGNLINQKCDEILSIEMQPGVESLNASVSFAIALYQFIHCNPKCNRK